MTANSVTSFISHHADAYSTHVEVIQALLDIIMLCKANDVLLEHVAQVISTLGHHDECSSVAFIDCLDNLREVRLSFRVAWSGTRPDLVKRSLVPTGNMCKMLLNF
jgi:hypothetical protein